jgi:hypothetical protein
MRYALLALAFIALLPQALALTGDVNNDGVVNTADLIIIISNFGRTSGFTAGSDVNSDNIVNLYDLVIIGQNWGTSGAVSTGISGTITNTTGNAVGGGVVQVFSGSTNIANLTVTGAGTYSTTVADGTYTLMYHPPFTHSLGAGEPTNKSVTVSGSSSAPINFVAQTAWYADDFQAYTTDAQLRTVATAPGTFFYGPNHDGNVAGDPLDIHFDATGGPSSTKTMRYDWPARTTCPNNNPQTCSYYIGLAPRFNPTPVPVGTEFWVRFTDRTSPGFRIGGGGATGSQAEYKYMFIDLFVPGQGVGTLQMELDSQQSGAPNNLVQMRLKLLNPNNTGTYTDGLPGAPGGLDAPLPASFFGSWNTWVVGFTGVGTAQTTAWVYRDGVLLKNITGPWFANTVIPANAVLDVQMGANINNGPDVAQSRWWREFAVYPTRPSLLPLTTSSAQSVTTLSGTVTNTTGGVAGGGSVQVFSGSTTVANLTVAANGTYSTTSLSAGTYTLKLQPSLSYSLGPSEPDNRSATLTTGATTTTNFVVQPALYADDFQSYTTAQLIGGSGYLAGQIPAGNFWAGPNHDINIAHPDWMSMDPTGGPNGTKAARYDWPANPWDGVSPLGTSSSGYCGNGPTVSLIPRQLSPPATATTLWVRFTSKESAGFQHGSASCNSVAGLAYKFFLIQPYNSTTTGQVGLYFGNSVWNETLPTQLVTNMVVSGSTSTWGTGESLGGPGSSWGGAYHTWVVEMRNINSSNATVNVYLDGQLLPGASFSGPFLVGQNIQGSAIAFDLGSIINNGPDNAQTRWWREFAVYTTRPSLLPLQ